MRSSRHRGRSDGVGRWLLPALLLHAAAALLAAGLFRGTGASLASVVSGARWEVSSELTLLDGERPSSAAQEAPQISSLEGASVATRVAGASPAHEASEPSSAESELSAELPPATEDAEDPGAEAASLPSATPTLSLDQLGIGTSTPFRAVSPAALSPAAVSPAASSGESRARRDQRAHQRLQASLHQGLLESDRRRGLGAGGPVLDAARRLVLASDVLLDTHSILNVRVDAGGRVTNVEVLEASNQTAGWQGIAEGLLKALGPVTLRVSSSNEGFDLKLRLVTRLQLPSGADPGLRTELLGQNLRAGDGPGSASISLSPKAPLPKLEVFDTAGRQLDSPIKFEVGLLEGHGDASDLGASAQRVVSVSLLAVAVRAAP